jgi:hypothetical protein
VQLERNYSGEILDFTTEFHNRDALMTSEKSGAGLASTTRMPSAKPAMTPKKRQIVLKEIGAKWGKFSEEELSALKS